MQNNILVEISSTKFYRFGNPHAIITGFDENGIPKSVWLEWFPNSDKPKINHIANRDDGISKEKAMSIATDTGNLYTIVDVRLEYLTSIQDIRTDNLFWIIEGKPSQVIYINFYSGEVKYIDEQTE